MALAVIEAEGSDERELTFRVDIGTNRLFTYAIGDGGSRSRVDGFTLMEERTYESPMQELPPQSLGRTVIGVPHALFDAEGARDIQLLSFREQRLGANVGPAVSDIVPVRRRLADLRGAAGFALQTDGPAIATTAFREEARPLSTAMFLEFLTGIASKILPVVQNVLGSPQAGSLLTNILGSLAPAAPPGGGAAPAPAPVLETLAKPENAKLITELLQKLLTGAVAGETKSVAGDRKSVV